MLQMSAPFSVGFGGHNASAPPPQANAVPGQAGGLAPGVAPVSTGQNQTNSAVPATGNPSQSDTDAQGNNTETPTRGQYSSQQGEEQLSEEEQRQLQELQNRDRQVRAHEAAHAAAGGRYVSRGPSFSYQRGPDGRQYAVGGEVKIDTSPVPGDPQATLDKAEAIRAAASAPINPSSQDRRVALAAARMAARARLEMLQQQQAEEGYPEGYEPPGIRAYNNLSNYFQRQASHNAAPISVQA